MKNFVTYLFFCNEQNKKFYTTLSKIIFCCLFYLSLSVFIIFLFIFF